MAFWDNVVVELEYLGMTNKSLAEQAGFAASNIGKGIRLGSSPSADTAVKIARILGVSVEYLVTGSEPGESAQGNAEELRLCHKYARFMEDMESLPAHEREAIISMAAQLREANHS